MSDAEPTASDIVRQLLDFVKSQGNTDYLGESISQLEHSLQCAHLAQQSEQFGHDNEVVLAALLHDIGRFIPAAKNMPKMIAPDGTYVGTASHDVLGERYLRQLGFSEKVCQLVGAHVWAKRYLTATEPGYYEALSSTSKRTLKYQVCFSDLQFGLMDGANID
jgi:putative nucleotidyltransferase with HDIG domain